MLIRPFNESDTAAVITVWCEVFAYPTAHNDPATAYNN
jgi:hypothetical protein